MEPVREGLFTKIGVIVAIIGVAITWYYAPNRAVVPEVVKPVGTPSPTPVESVPAPSPSASPVETVDPPAPPHRDQPGLPLEFTLHDGDQKTFLEDQASVAAEFNQVGSEEFVTLKVGTTEGEPVPHAVLGAGARYTFRLSGNTYSVYVLSVDKSARTVGVRISRSSESQ
ncbi:MAG: hypothetical protein QOF89_5107 [Acidobacteriota bacterium]|jgi:hypothetical protein|nr:hypothetical protein [Acidobacteriota bacterium]